jgi:hypothetical protein
VNASVAIAAQVLALLLLPDLAELLDSLEDKASLVVGQLAVLAKRVDAHDVALLLREERLLLNIRPLALFSVHRLSVTLLFLPDCALRFFPLLPLFLLLFASFLDCSEVSHCFVKCGYR